MVTAVATGFFSVMNPDYENVSLLRLGDSSRDIIEQLSGFQTCYILPKSLFKDEWIEKHTFCNSLQSVSPRTISSQQLIQHARTVFS